MMKRANTDYVRVENPQGPSRILVICEHASNVIPPDLNGLGLSQAALTSHAAWDIGAQGLASALAEKLKAPLVSSQVSRLVYDCNRPLSDASATPARSEIYDIPGNRDLGQHARARRERVFYLPFHNKVQQMLAGGHRDALVTIHSFTPCYHGEQREVEIGVLHDSDARLADALLGVAGDYTARDARRNAPYGPDDGVTHSLREYGIKNGLLNVMIEVRNDLIATETQQQQMAAELAPWLGAAFELAQQAEQVR